MRNGITPPPWPEVWRRIRGGYGYHVQVLKKMLAEQEELNKQGYGNPLDGFVSAALHAAEFERDAALKAQKDYSAEKLMQAFERTLQGLFYYADADLSWSETWNDYRPVFNSWISDIRKFLKYGRQEPDLFIDYTTRKWEL